MIGTCAPTWGCEGTCAPDAGSTPEGEPNRALISVRRFVSSRNAVARRPFRGEDGGASVRSGRQPFDLLRSLSSRVRESLVGPFNVADLWVEHED